MTVFTKSEPVFSQQRPLGQCTFFESFPKDEDRISVPRLLDDLWLYLRLYHARTHARDYSFFAGATRYSFEVSEYPRNLNKKLGCETLRNTAACLEGLISFSVYFSRTRLA